VLDTIGSIYLAQQAYDQATACFQEGIVDRPRTLRTATSTLVMRAAQKDQKGKNR